MSRPNFVRGTGPGNLPWWTLLGGGGLISGAQIDAATTVTASATTHTKGSWAQVIASTASEATLIAVNVSNVGSNGVDTGMLLDIGVGAAGSEVVRASNIAVGGAIVGSNGSGALSFFLPMRVASGSRIAVRCQSAGASRTGTVSIAPYMMGAAHMVPETLDVIGVDTATSRGTAASGANGSWFQIIASTAQRYRALLVIPSVIGSSVGTARAIRWTVGHGTANAESALGTSAAFHDTLERVSTPGAIPCLPIPCDLPSGTRIAVRHDIPSSPGEFGCCVIGVPA
jgi:hypothetical protein